MSSKTVNNQNDFQRVTTKVIEKLTSHWSINLKPDVTNDYIVALAKFDNKTLENAMKFLVENCENAPRLATIVKACKEHKTVSIVTGDSPAVWYAKRREEEDLKMQRARTKTIEYVDFKMSMLSQTTESLAPHMKDSLREYLMQSALLQAQIIEKIKNPGYTCPFILKDEGKEDERFLWWIAMEKRQREDIDVEIPWKWFGLQVTQTAGRVALPKTANDYRVGDDL